MLKHTALHSRHQAAGARLVDFGGWDMPLHYGSQLDEHRAVRSRAGVFDVSHMTVVDVDGSQAAGFLGRLLANDVARLSDGRGLYSCMLNTSGGVIDDLIAYRLAADVFRLVVNAGTRDQDLAWLERQAGAGLGLRESPGGVMLAVQGPGARELAVPLLPESLREQALSLAPFGICHQAGVYVARTGYTGEDGWELIFDDPAAGLACWDGLQAAGVQACGLGARDTLRLEAGLALYGQDLDQQHSPLTSGLAWTVAWEPGARDFIGRSALQAERASGPAAQLVGLLLEDRGIMRHGQRVQTPQGEGEITSGGFSPTLERSIALARVPAGASGQCQVDIRGALRNARIVRPAFVRHGKVLIEL